MQRQIEGLNQRLEEAERDRAHTKQLVAQRIQALDEKLARQQGRREGAEEGGARTEQLAIQYQEPFQALNGQVAREQDRREQIEQVNQVNQVAQAEQVEQVEQVRDELARVQAQHETVTQEDRALSARVEDLERQQNEAQRQYTQLTEENTTLRARVERLENQQTEAQQRSDAGGNERLHRAATESTVHYQQLHNRLAGPIVCFFLSIHCRTAI